MVQYNPTPWVVLVLVVMAGCAITGMLLGNVGPFNSQVAEAKIPVQQTQGALNSLVTQQALELVQTQQAPLVQGTAVSAQMTMVPLQQTATQIAVQDASQLAQAAATQTAIAGAAWNNQIISQATQTSIANELYMQNLARNATVTAIAQTQSQDQATGLAGTAMVGLLVLVICGWIVTRALSQITTARAKEKEAHAQLLAEQRRLATARAAIQAQKEGHQQYPLPNSLMKNPGNGKGLPLA